MTVKQIGQANDDGMIGQRSCVNHLLGFVTGVTPPESGETMFNCKVIKETRARTGASIYAAGQEMLPVGYTFQAETFQAVTETVLGMSVTGLWVQLPDGRWTAAEYKGEKFVEYTEVVITDPPTVVLKPFILDVEGYKPFAGELEPDTPTTGGTGA